MNKENKVTGKKLKENMLWAVKNPLDACVEAAFYIICMAIGIWILGFALSFLIKIMSPMIFLT